MSHVVARGTPEFAEALRNAFKETPLHKLLDFEFLQIDDELVVVEMPVTAGALNSGGNLHGGAIATLVDVAAGTAAAHNSAFVPGENTIVTADMHVRYLGRAKGTRVRAEAQVMRAGRQLVVVECRVLDEDGRIIAFADFSSMVVPFREPLPIAAEAATPESPDL
ncbi:MAG: PaaI family thioesterase [Actinobacteria bacterium]|nr:PaaI family thioesterase [Actinomycetota bacterium]